MSAEDNELTMSTDIQFEPSSHAISITEEVKTATNLQKEILEESIEEGTESGRSICGSKENAKEPIARSFTSVVLPGCPLDHRGLVHAGGGHDLHAPSNSLLDMSNVLFGLASASAVVGTRRTEVFLAPAGDQMDQAQLVFKNTLGVDVNSPDEYKRARDSGRIQNPIAAARKIRSELDPLFVTLDTPHPELEMDATTSLSANLNISVASALQQPSERMGNIVADILTIGNEVLDLDFDAVNVNLPQRIVGEFVDAILLLLFLRLLGARPRQLAQQVA